MKWRKRRKKMLYNPMQLTEALKKLGDKYDKKTAGLYYMVVLFLAVAFGFFMELHPVLIVVVAAAYFFFVPTLIYNQHKHVYEKRRFQDINSYMHQMVQSFLRTGNIPMSLRETLNTITTGPLHDILAEGIESLDNPDMSEWSEEEQKGGFNPRAAEEKILKKIEARYGCEKLRTLHDFLLKAEQRGGESTAEFALLEKTRLLWESAVEEYHKTLLSERTYGSLMYVMVMVVDIVLMRYLERMNLSISGDWITQLVNTAMLIIFIAFFSMLDKRLNNSLLEEAKPMRQEVADELYSYMQGFDSKRERRKYIAVAVLATAAGVAFVAWKPSFANLCIGIGIAALGFNVHRIILAFAIKTIKGEIKKEFPKWLFDMLLLLQRESVEGAIFLSVEKASPVLKAELGRISAALLRNPRHADTYMSFLADFGIPYIEDTMRTLYSLAEGTGGDKLEAMGVIIDSNITLLAQAEKDRIRDKGSYSNVIETLPLFIGAAAMMGYTVVLFMTTLKYLASML